MGLISSKIRREQLRPGDHIYTWRSGHTYSHPGIYVGDGKVIHLTRGPGLIIFSSSSRSQPSNDRVVRCNIEDFLCDGQLYRFKYGVSEFVFLIKRANICSLANSNPIEQVLHRASYLLEHGFGNYHLFGKNCEDFALYCKTGLVEGGKTGGGISGQMISIVSALVVVIIIPYQFMPASIIGVALVVCGLYCFVRLISDVGSENSDHHVVAVEELVHLSIADDVTDNMNMMEEKTPRCSLRDSSFITDTFWAIRYWYWTPKSKILIWLKSVIFYTYLHDLVSKHLRLYGFKLGEYSAYTIWLLAYWYWRWTSVSTILLWTRFLFLFSFLNSFIYDHPRSLKHGNYSSNTIWILELWYWTPGSTFLQWIKLALVYYLLFYFVPNHLRNRRLMRGAFLVCFVIQSAALVLGLDYSDYIYRITKMTFL